MGSGFESLEPKKKVRHDDEITIKGISAYGPPVVRSSAGINSSLTDPSHPFSLLFSRAREFSFRGQQSHITPLISRGARAALSSKLLPHWLRGAGVPCYTHELPLPRSHPSPLGAVSTTRASRRPSKKLTPHTDNALWRWWCMQYYWCTL